MTSSAPRPPGRPRDVAKSAAILDAGWALFLRRGIEATSIEAIAAAAHVSKVTLYSHFPDKAALFVAAVRREMQRIEHAQRLGADDTQSAPIATQLRRFGLGLLRFLTTSPATDFWAVIAGELRRHETLARAFYDQGPGRSRANLAALIEAAMRRGELVELDPDGAADQLFGLWQGFSTYQTMLGIGVDQSAADIPARVDRGIDAFMRLYGPNLG